MMYPFCPKYDRISRTVTTCMLAMLACIVSFAANSDAKTLMILNSYNENEPWVSAMIQPLVLKLNQNMDVDCVIVNLNNVLITNEDEFNTCATNLISEYSDPQPSYVVMIGDLAFNMRGHIQQAWGKDIPILLINTINDYVSINEYFKPKFTPADVRLPKSLDTLRDSCNFTAIIIPECYKQTVDLMMDVMPDMDKMVFLSDSIYVNRRLAYDIQRYIKDEYPQISFSWLKANPANGEAFRSCLSDPMPKSGILLSTWLYEKRSVNGVTIPTAADLKLISASVNPIFSMHEAYVPLGSVGGVFPVTELAQERELSIVEDMVAGKSMREIPIYTCDQYFPKLNYRRMIEYGLKIDRAPQGTSFYGRPPTFWEKYLWETIAGILVLLVVLGYMFKHNMDQRQKIMHLRRNKEFVDNMPIPYSTAQVLYDSEGEVTTIKYAVKNEAFDRLVQDNMVEGSPFLLFPASFIGPKVVALLKGQNIERFIYHFANTDSYYEFILCQVETAVSKIKKKNSHQVIDIFALDITDQQKTAMQLAETSHKLDISMSVTKIHPWSYDFNTDTIVYDTYEDQSTYEWGDVKPTTLALPYDTFIDNAHPDDRQMLFQLREDVRRNRTRKFCLRYRQAAPDDSSRYEWHELTGVVVEMDDADNPLRVIGSNANINEQIQHQEDMAQALAKANESDRLKSAFLASMSHEIRTPLNAIVGFSNVIAHTESAQDRLEFCDIINRNNEQLLSLINDVLDLAKIESNTVDINYSECDINRLLDNVAKTMRTKVPGNVKFNVVKTMQSCVVEVDRTRLTQILSNLISNACKFTPNGSITVGYEVTDHGMLYFYVRDTGVGISRENVKKVFDRFFKLDSFVPGTGLGLSICKNLVEKMGGEIGVESSGEGKGSLFWFTTPYIPVNIDTMPATEDDGFFKKNMSHMKMRLRVLIAEDNDSNYRLLAHLLKSTYDIRRANNGEEAVEIYRQWQPDVVLMDISMPGMDGYRAFDAIRLLNPRIPIIAVTAYVYASDRTKIHNYGFNGYVAKPITQRAIIDAIGRAMAGQPQ